MSSFPQVSPPESAGLLTRIRLCLGLLIFGLLVLGVGSFPLISESKALLDLLARSAHFGAGTPLFEWVLRVHLALAATAVTAPFLAYRTDALALAYLLFAVLFFGPYREPVRNQWVINFGLIACVAILLLTFIAGPIRGIPVFWRLVNAAFAVACALPLLLCSHYLSLLNHLDSTAMRQRKEKTRRMRHKQRVRDRRTLLP